MKVCGVSAFKLVVILKILPVVTSLLKQRSWYHRFSWAYRYYWDQFNNTVYEEACRIFVTYKVSLVYTFYLIF